MLSDQLNQKLLASAVRDEAPEVAPSLFNNNGEMRENNKAEVMNEVCTTLIDVLTDAAFHVIYGCPWLLPHLLGKSW